MTIPDCVATMTGNGGRQDATFTQGQDCRAAAALPPSDTIGSRDFNSCGGIMEGVGMGRGFRIEVVSTSADSHHWRIKGGNGEIICHSETYTTRSAAMQTLDSFAAWIGGLVAASVQFVDAEVPES